MANGAQILTIILESIAAKVHIKPTSCSQKTLFTVSIHIITPKLFTTTGCLEIIF